MDELFLRSLVRSRISRPFGVCFVLWVFEDWAHMGMGMGIGHLVGVVWSMVFMGLREWVFP